MTITDAVMKRCGVTQFASLVTRRKVCQPEGTGRIPNLPGTAYGFSPIPEEVDFLQICRCGKHSGIERNCNYYTGIGNDRECWWCN